MILHVSMLKPSDLISWPAIENSNFITCPKLSQPPFPSFVPAAGKETVGEGSKVQECRLKNVYLNLL